MTDPLSQANYQDTKEILRDTSAEPTREVLELRRATIDLGVMHIASVVPEEIGQSTSPQDAPHHYLQEAA